MNPTEAPSHLDIDFLPAKFREQNSKRQVKTWRYAVAAVLGVLLLAGIGMQQRNRFILRSEAAALQPLFEESQSRSAEFKSMQAELETSAHRAELVTYLQHPWPRTQVLRALMEPLPETVLLTEVAMSLETADGQPKPATASPSPAKDSTAEKGEKKAEKLDDAQLDLKQLREEYDGRLLVVSLSGHAANLEQLYSYLSQLSNQELVIKAELRSLESAGQLAVGSKFNARIVVRPGYGQPSGPKAPPTAKTDKIARGL